MHGHDQGHGRLLRSKSVLYPAPAKTIPAPIQATQLKLDEETRWQIAGEAVAGLRRFTPRDRAAEPGLWNAAKDLLFAANARGCGTQLRHANLG